jgi:hypothetical protein
MAALQNKEALSTAVGLSVRSFHWAAEKVLNEARPSGTTNRFAIEPLQLLRLTTFLVTIQLALRIPPGLLAYDEAMDIVHKVDKYFKVCKQRLLFMGMVTDDDLLHGSHAQVHAEVCRHTPMSVFYASWLARERTHDDDTIWSVRHTFLCACRSPCYW